MKKKGEQSLCLAEILLTYNNSMVLSVTNMNPEEARTKN